MKKEEAIEIIDKMIQAIPEACKDVSSFTCSPDIYYALDCKEYKGFKIFTSNICPQKEWACSGSLYF